MIVKPLVWLLVGYRRWISPLFTPKCRFVPTCSEYAVVALQTHGAPRGSWLALRRLLRCQPFCRGGYDPVPPARRRSPSWPAQPASGPGSPTASRGVPR